MKGLLRPGPLLILAAALGHFGWGAVLPYQYVYATHTRGWGPAAGASAASLFSVGALLGAVLIGHFTGRFRPERVLHCAWGAALLGVGGMWAAERPVTFVASSFVFGAGIAGSSPAKSVLILRWAAGEDQRRVFAYRFSAESIGMALGALLSGALVDLSSRHGMRPAYLIAGTGVLLAHAVAWAAARAAPRDSSDASELLADSPGVIAAMRQALSIRPLRWLAAFTVCYALGFYAQFEAGLPAFALTVLNAPALAVGAAAATNCLGIAALQYPMLRATQGRDPARLLAIVGWIWVACWVTLSSTSLLGPSSVSVFVASYGIFAVGETVFTPVLNPLVARLSPPATVGTTIGVFAALLTTLTAVGPLIAGPLLGSGLPSVFLGLQVVISLAMVPLAIGLGRTLRSTGPGVGRPE